MCLLLKAFTPSPLKELRWFKICVTGRIQGRSMRCCSHRSRRASLRGSATSKKTATKGFCLRLSGGITELWFFNHHVQWSGSTTETADPVTKLNQLGFQSYAHFLKREKLISSKLKSSFFHITVVVEIHTFACHYQVTS